MLLQMALFLFWLAKWYSTVYIYQHLYPLLCRQTYRKEERVVSVQSNSVLCYVMSLQLGSSLGNILSQDFLKIAHFTEGNPVCRKMFWKTASLRSRREAWYTWMHLAKEWDPYQPSPRSTEPPEHLGCHHPPSRGREKGKLFPSQVKATQSRMSLRWYTPSGS